MIESGGPSPNGLTPQPGRTNMRSEAGEVGHKAVPELKTVREMKGMKRSTVNVELK